MKAWVKAIDLKPGDFLGSCDAPLLINDVKTIEDEAIVFSISVETFHNFYVSVSEAHVHNFAPAITLVTVSTEGVSFLGGVSLAGFATITIKKLFDVAFEAVADCCGATVYYQDVYDLESIDNFFEQKHQGPIFKNEPRPQCKTKTLSPVVNEKLKQNQLPLPTFNINELNKIVEEKRDSLAQQVRKRLQDFRHELDIAHRIIEQDFLFEGEEKEGKLMLLDYVHTLCYEAQILLAEGKIEEAEKIYDAISYSLFEDIFEEVPVSKAVKDKKAKEVIETIRIATGSPGLPPKKPDDEDKKKKDENTTYRVDVPNGRRIKKFEIPNKKIDKHIFVDKHNLSSLGSRDRVLSLIVDAIKRVDQNHVIKDNASNQIMITINNTKVVIRYFPIDGVIKMLDMTQKAL